MKWLLVLLIAACNAAGDVLNTRGMKRHGVVHEFHPGAVARLIATLLRNPYILGGTAAMAVAFFALMALLSISRISFAIPATAGSYVLETLLARYILKEHVNRKRWIGASLVAGGVALLAL